MRRSKIAKEDREALSRISQRMKPEERLVAYLRHSQLLHRLYQAGLKHRMAVRLSSRTPTASG